MLTGTEKQKQEALLRLEQLTEKFELNPKIVKYFKEGKLYYSYWVGAGFNFGCIDTITYDPSYEKTVREFEKQYHGFVYHVIESVTPFGKMLTMLYVSEESQQEDWETERPEEDYIFAYVYNLDDNFGEFGDVFLTSDNGALLRKA